MVDFVICPLCCQSRILNKTGNWAVERGIPVGPIKGQVRFDNMVDIENTHIIDIRQPAGRGSGFPSTGEGYTLAKMVEDEGYRDLVEQIHNQVTKIKEYLDELLE